MECTPDQLNAEIAARLQQGDSPAAYSPISRTHTRQLWVTEEAGNATGVHKNGTFPGPDGAFCHPGEQTGSGPRGVDGIQHEALSVRHKLERLFGCHRESAVIVADLVTT